MRNIYITKSRTRNSQSTRKRKYTPSVQKRSRRLEKRPEKRASFSAGEVAVKITNARVFFNTCTRFSRPAAHLPPYTHPSPRKSFLRRREGSVAAETLFFLFRRHAKFKVGPGKSGKTRGIDRQRGEALLTNWPEH